MANQQIRLQSTNILSRFKVFEETHHLNHKVYLNRGVLKDAERFSLVDSVLDGEYNDFEIHDYYKPAKQKKQTFTKWNSMITSFGRGIAGIAFRCALWIRFSVYYVFHHKYRA